MPYIPHTPDDVKEMLAEINIKEIAELFDEIPRTLPKTNIDTIPSGLNEFEMSRLIHQRVPHHLMGANFIGAGAYEHYIPAAVWDIVGRGEFYTAYTPYQAEASQGTLQLIFEYQTMMASLMGMDVSNASLYDGASALAESILMAVRIKQHRAKRIIVPTTVHPIYRKVLSTILKHQDILIEELHYDSERGNIMADHLKNINRDGLAAVVIPQPNFLGIIEEVDKLTDITHQLNALVIAAVNPTAMALLKPPGQWGNQGADIVCGEGQPLGVPLSFGGPYFGFICCKKEYVRQMPGRIVGETTDAEGNVGYTLTLQAREQHIRRAKATSNICTNQGLLVTAATIYMSIIGPHGLRSVAAQSHHNAKNLCERLTTIQGVSQVFPSPYFHEFVLRFKKPVDQVLKQLSLQGLEGGYSLKQYYPELGECLLVCATETKTSQDLERYQQLLSKSVLSGEK